MKKTDIEVFYPSGRNLPNWEASYGQGAVPDRWPYGLNRMDCAEGFSVSAVEAQPLKPISLARALLRISGSSRIRSRTSTAIAWDEDLAVRLAIERADAAKLAGVIWCTDRIVNGQKTTKDTLLRRILPRFSGLWTLSRAQTSVLGDWLGHNSPPLDFLRFGIDHEFFSPAPYPEEPLVLSIGRDRDRDPSTLFDALEEIKRMRPDARIAIQTTSERPLPAGAEAVPMLPHAELRDYYKKASVVLVATRPNLHVSGMTVALETMATARPIVISRTPGMDDYVEDGVSGLLYAPGDSKGMAEGTLDLLADPFLAAKMGRAGRESVECRHTTELMARALGEIITKRTA